MCNWVLHRRREPSVPYSTKNDKRHAVPQELQASLLADYEKPDDLMSEYGLLERLTNLLLEKDGRGVDRVPGPIHRT